MDTEYWITGFPQELETVRFNSESKRYKSVSILATRSVLTLVPRRDDRGTQLLRAAAPKSKKTQWVSPLD